MKNTALILAFALIFTGASPAAHAEVNPESIIQIFQRLEILEKKNRELHGQNEVLRHQIEQLKKVQKQGFLNVDERIDELIKNNSAATKPVSEEGKPSPTPPQNNLTPAPTENKTTTAEEKADEKSETAKTEAASTDSSTESPEAKPDADTKENNTQETASADKKIRQPTEYEKETYQAAFNKMNSSPAAATRAFEEYIKLQPDSPLAANAQYWIGEIKYSHNNYKGAVEEFIKVLQKYKNSNKAPDAAIKLGYSFHALKNWAYARRTFEDVLKYFPDNKNAVTLANKRLEKMKAEGH